MYTVVATVNIDWTASYGGTAPQSFTNTAVLQDGGGAPLNDTNLTNNSSSFTNAGSQADLSITKASTGVVAGALTTYTIQVTNNGPSDAVKPQVTDSIPPQFDIWTLPSECGAVGRDITCDYLLGAVLGIGDDWFIPIEVISNDPALSAGTSITNTATVSSTTPDPTLTNNTASVTDQSTQETDVGVTIDIQEPDPSYTGAGSQRHVVVTLFNNGPSTATNVIFHVGTAVDVTPDSTIPSWCTLLSRQMTCTLPMPLPPNPDPDSTYVFEFDVTLPPSVVHVTLQACTPQNTTCPLAGGWASVSSDQVDSNLANNQDSDELDVDDPQTDLAIDKQVQSAVTNTDGHPAFVAGATFAYTIDVWVEESAADAQNVSVTDTLPAGLTLTQVNTPQGSCALTNTSFNCAIGTVPGTPAGSTPQKVRITVYGTVASSLEEEQWPNTATATSSTTNQGQGAAASVSSTTYVDVVRYSDLSLNKLVDAPLSYAGNQVGYTLMAINNGPSDVLHGIVTDILPRGLTLDLGLSGDCVVDAAQTAAQPFGQQVVVCAVGTSLADPTDVTQGAFIAANTSANVRIVADTLPRDLRPVWCTGQDGVEGVICPEVEPPADLSTQYPRNIANSAIVSSHAVDNDPNNNSASAPSILDWLADIAVTSSVSTTTPSAGTDITFTLTGQNNGPSAADDPVAEVTFPPGWLLMMPDGVTPCPDGDSLSNGCVAVMSPGMNCEIRSTTDAGTGVTSQSIYCTGKRETFYVGSFNPGYTIPGVVTVRIPDDTPNGSYDITGVAYSRSTTQCLADQPRPADAGTCESDYSNNTTVATVYVSRVADTSIVKELVAPTPMVAGEQAVYRMTVTNAGPSVATDVVISDQIPDHLTYVSGRVDGGALCPAPQVDPDGNQTFDCEVGTLGVGESVSALLTFMVDPTDTLKADPNFDGRLCNTGLVGSTALDLNSLDNEDEACAEVDTSTVTPPPPGPGGSPSDPGLPNTGWQLAGFPLQLAAALLVGGLWLRALRRSHRETEDTRSAHRYVARRAAG
jgi:uncharacterized repeat protein (TIGR01451 family)/fimbrial isopeptide formation D2 family protein